MESLQLRSRCRYVCTITTMAIGWCVPFSAIGNVNERWLGLPFHLLPRGLQGWGWMQEDDEGGFLLPQQMLVLLLEQHCTSWQSAPEGKRTPGLEYRAPLDGTFHSVSTSVWRSGPTNSLLSPPPCPEATPLSRVRSEVVAALVRGPAW